MITWMRHPEHGRMPVYDHTGVENAKKAGWVVITDVAADQRAAIAAKTAVPKASDATPKKGGK